MEVGGRIFDELRDSYQKVVNSVKKYQDEEFHGKQSSNIKFEEARRILEEMQMKLEKIQGDVKHGIKIKCMLSVVHLDMATFHADNGNIEDSKLSLTRCLEILESYEMQPEGILIFMTASNLLCNFLWESEEYEDAELIALKANNTFNKYKRERVDQNEKMIMPLGRCSSFGIQDKECPKRTLNRLNDMALCFLAKVYSALSDREKSFQYSQLSVQNQLERPDYDHMYIALTLAKIAQFFIERKVFTQARYHLAAASHVLKVYDGLLKKSIPLVVESRESRDADLKIEFEELHSRSSDTARCWIKYGIALMKGSREKLSGVETAVDRKNTEKSWIEMKFPKFEKGIKTIEAQVTDKYLLNFEDAKKVFLSIQQWLDEAKKFFTFDERTPYYVEIVHDHSEAYNHLAFFETDVDRKAKMHKRRINMLEELIKNLNQKNHQGQFRQICYSLGDAYSSLCDTKWDKIKSKIENKTPQALNKVNHLGKSAIEYYWKFLDSLGDSVASSSIVKFTDKFVHQALLSYIYIATLNNGLVATIDGKKQKLEYMKKAHAAYQFIISYCKRYPDATKYVKTELICCNDIVPLLSKQILSLENSSSSVS